MTPPRRARTPSLDPQVEPLYASVAVDRPLDHSYSYLVPHAMALDLRVGSMVEVPLKSQSACGVVTAIESSINYKGPVKPITRHLTPEYHLTPELMRLAEWLAGYYWCSLGEAFRTVAFLGLNDVKERMISHLALAHPDHWLAVSREKGPDGSKVTPAQARVLHALLALGNQPLTAAELREEAGVGDGVLQTMLRHGWLERVQEPAVIQDDYAPVPAHLSEGPELTPAQAAVVEAVTGAFNRADPAVFLLQGVTGSGKTEVYLRVIEEGLRRGRGAVMLVPEISLTPQTVAAFRARLGELVGVYHSKLTIQQKFDLWRRIHTGEVRVVIGARSAVFAPVAHLGVIVVDEEHEASYKQGETPRYHARDVAVWRASRLPGVALLGSATPSLESCHNAREGKYRHLELPERVGPHAPPRMTVIDMRRQLSAPVPQGRPNEAGVTESMLVSPQLQAAIARRLEANEQTVLLLNRRGFANFVFCMKCEKPVQCPNCDVTMTWHKHVNKLVCHWCGHTGPLPKACPDPKCGAEEIQALGFGTQRVEEVVGRLFPAARTIRIDVDTMQGRRASVEAWNRINGGEIDIIMGTQMIAKGLHLERVTLVGVISADFALFLPDFRSAERTFNLLTQVAGRAGRGGLPGEVLVQTFLPHHYAIEHAARLAQKDFYDKEMHIRRMLRFPPASRLIALLLTGRDNETVREQAGRLGNMLKSLAWRAAYKEVRVLGPAPAPIARIKEEYRWRILLRGPVPRDLHELLRQGLKVFEEVHDRHRVAVIIDVDPVDLM